MCGRREGMCGRREPFPGLGLGLAFWDVPPSCVRLGWRTEGTAWSPPREHMVTLGRGRVSDPGHLVRSPFIGQQFLVPRP